MGQSLAPKPKATACQRLLLPCPVATIEQIATVRCCVIYSFAEVHVKDFAENCSSSMFWVKNTSKIPCKVAATWNWKRQLHRSRVVRIQSSDFGRCCLLGGCCCSPWHDTTTRVAFQKSQATSGDQQATETCHEAAEDGSPPLPFHLGGGGEQANREEQSRVVGGAPFPHRKRTPSIITGYGKSIQMDRGTESYLMESTGNWVNPSSLTCFL